MIANPTQNTRKQTIVELRNRISAWERRSPQAQTACVSTGCDALDALFPGHGIRRKSLWNGSGWRCQRCGDSVAACRASLVQNGSPCDSRGFSTTDLSGGAVRLRLRSLDAHRGPSPLRTRSTLGVPGIVALQGGRCRLGKDRASHGTRISASTTGGGRIGQRWLFRSPHSRIERALLGQRSFAGDATARLWRISPFPNESRL